MNSVIKVTRQFVEYSQELAEDILGYNICFNGNIETRKKLKYHIKRCKKY